MQTHSRDGRTWSRTRAIGPFGWGFWRVVEHGGSYYSTAYEDGDLRIVLYRSRDGLHWKRGTQIYGVSADTPLEAELAFSPSGRSMLALVRLDGNNTDLLGFEGRLRTKVCWARAPFSSFRCPRTLTGVRLDGAVAFYWRDRLFVIARKHLRGPGIRKRTALYELTGDLNGATSRSANTASCRPPATRRTPASRRWTGRASSSPGTRARCEATRAGRPLRRPTNIWKATIDLSRL